MSISSTFLASAEKRKNKSDAMKKPEKMKRKARDLEPNNTAKRVKTEPVEVKEEKDKEKGEDMPENIDQLLG